MAANPTVRVNVILHSEPSDAGMPEKLLQHIKDSCALLDKYGKLAPEWAQAIVALAEENVRLTREHDQAVQDARLEGARIAIAAAQSICESRASSLMAQNPMRISEANEASKCASAIRCFWQDAVPKDDPLYVKWSLIPAPSGSVTER